MEFAFNLHHDARALAFKDRPADIYNPFIATQERQILGPPEVSYHPLRWILCVACSLPILLLLSSLAGQISGHQLFPRNAARCLTLVVNAEMCTLMVFAMAGAVYERHARAHDAEQYHPAGKLVDIGGYGLHVNCMGAGGPTVVLEYGLEASYFDWIQVQPEIARFTRVCYYDRAGYGWSDPSPRRRISSVMAEELHALLHAAGEKPPFILAGHSFGTFNALMFAHNFPEEVAGLVLIDGPSISSSLPFRLQERLSLRTMQVLIPFGLPRWRGWCGGAAPEQLRGEKQAVMCRSNLYDVFYVERAGFSEDIAELKAISSLGSIPLIVIARDPAIGDMPREQWEAVQQEKLRLSSHSELIVAAKSGHDVPRDRPDVIVSAVRKLVFHTPGTGGHPGNSVTNVLPM